MHCSPRQHWLDVPQVPVSATQPHDPDVQVPKQQSSLVPQATLPLPGCEH